MRQSLVRRLVAALFVVVGIGAVSSTLPAQASPVQSQHQVKSAADWQWGG